MHMHTMSSRGLHLLAGHCYRGRAGGPSRKSRSELQTLAHSALAAQDRKGGKRVFAKKSGPGGQGCLGGGGGGGGGLGGVGVGLGVWVGLQTLLGRKEANLREQKDIQKDKSFRGRAVRLQNWSEILRSLRWGLGPSL